MDLDTDKIKLYMENKCSKKDKSVYSEQTSTTDNLLGTEPYFSDIPFNRPLIRIPAKFKKMVAGFHGYLNATSKISIKIVLENKETGETFTKLIPYTHRWTVHYRQSILAKMFLLESYLGLYVENVEMISLTTHQRGLDPEYCLSQLKVYLSRLLNILRKRYGTTDYFRIFEPHKTSYPHIHIVFFKKLPEAEKKYLQYIWACVLGAGDISHGLLFSKPKESLDGRYKSGSIGTIRSYVMKYISKGIRSDEMSPAEQLFNALLWKTKTRLWSCSRNFSKVMAKENSPNYRERSPEWEFKESSICDSEGNLISEIPKLKVTDFKPTHKWEWSFLQSVSSLSAYLQKKIKSELLKVETNLIECFDRAGNLTYQTEYLIYEPVLLPVGVVHV